jgi:hypothetical protein
MASRENTFLAGYSKSRQEAAMQPELQAYVCGCHSNLSIWSFVENCPVETCGFFAPNS